MTARIGVVTFPGSLDDVDARRAVGVAGGEAVALWHRDRDLHGVDAVILPGGFSYGDYLRCGAIARFSPVMESVIAAARDGLPVLGICNGFQVLCESHLLPGALIRNASRRFVCRDQSLQICSTTTAWTTSYDVDQQIVIPLKNGEGGYVADTRTLDELEAEDRIVGKYVGRNPNGSYRNIAGVTNAAGNVVGLMPHPEHAVDPLTGPGIDGVGFFASVLSRQVTTEMTQQDPWQAPDPAASSGAPTTTSAAPWTAAGSAPVPPTQPQPPYAPQPWPGPFAPPPPRQPMSRRTRTLLIVGAVVVALLLIAGAAVLGVLVARDAAQENGDDSTLFPTLNADLVSDLDRLDENASWTESDTLSGASLDNEWAARLYSSSSATERTKDLLASLLQEDGYEYVTVTEYLEPRDVDYDFEVSGSKGDIYAIGYVGSEILYEYEDDGTAVDVEAPAGGSAITIRLSVTSFVGD